MEQRAAVVGMTRREYLIALQYLGNAWNQSIASVDSIIEAIHCRAFGGWRQGQTIEYFWGQHRRMNK